MGKRQRSSRCRKSYRYVEILWRAFTRFTRLLAHRTPQQVHEFTAQARENGFGVLIAAAGKAAHLAGSVAAGTTLPVIGIPIKSSTLDGL